LFTLFIQIFPQNITFRKTIGTGSCNSVVQTDDNGYIAVLNGTDNKLEVVRTDKYGDLIWKNDYGLFGSLSPSVVKTSDGNYLILASKKVYSNQGNLFLLKINLQGDTLWTKTFESTECELSGSLQKTSDGGFIIYGIVTDSITINQVKKQVLFKLANDYTTEWKQTYSIEHLPTFFNLFAIIEYGDGYAWLTNKYLTKINGSGEIEWSKAIVTNQYSVAKTLDNNILLVHQ